MVYQLPGSNVLEIAKAVKAKMEELSATFPEGLGYDRVVRREQRRRRVDRRDHVETLLIATILVILTVLIFLGRTSARR